MTDQIGVDKLTVRELFSKCQSKKFVVPEYQRPYAWGEEHIQKLFSDLWNFTVENVAAEHDSVKQDSYFLGTLVLCDNENKEQEIIDGQQRITSLFLLLRVIYAKLDNLAVKHDQDNRMLYELSQLIWKYDRRNCISYNEEILIVSKVINTDENNILQALMKTGKVAIGCKDNYSQNYSILEKLLDEACLSNFQLIYDFIINVLDNTVLLSIATDTEDTALTIFSTLNDSGLQLSDSDIFKAKIYKNKGQSERKQFVDNWKQLEEETNDIGESVQRLFTYHMFYLKAKNSDTNTQMVSVRKYYKGDEGKGTVFSKLYSNTLMEELFSINSIWKFVNKRYISGEGYGIKTWNMDFVVTSSLDILGSYPNEYWKYPVVVYFLCHKEEQDFVENFGVFLRMLICFLVKNYLVNPTINSVKSAILNLDKEIVSNNKPKIKCNCLEVNDKMIITPSKNIVKMMLKILAYQHQKMNLLPLEWEIEHILPQKWQPYYTTNESSEIVEEMIEHIGNKIPLQKKLNAKAGNNYFIAKKAEYRKSNFGIVRHFESASADTWGVQDIIKRDHEICDVLREVFANWEQGYYTVTNLFR